MDQFFIILQQLFIFFIFIIVGVISVKFGVLDSLGLDYISKFIIMVSMPIMLFTTMLNGPAINELSASLPILGLYTISFALLYLFNFLIAKLLKKKANQRNIYIAVSTFSNAGFIGIPLILSLFHSNGIIYMSLCMIIDQLALWTIGVYLTTPIENTVKLSPLKTLKSLISPALIAIIISLLGIISGITLPNLLNISLSPIGSTTIPLSLIYIGGLLCSINLKTLFKHAELYIIVFFKMLIYPIALWFTFKQLGLPVDIVKTVVILNALPTMSSIAMFAKRFGSDSNYAISAVTISTISCVFTLPLVTYIINYF